MQQRLRPFGGRGRKRTGRCEDDGPVSRHVSRCGRGVGLSSVRSPNAVLPSNDLEETWDMNNTVELKCWACEKPFNIQYGPGRPPRYCGPPCKNLARAIARRVRYVERIKQQRATRAETSNIENNSAN